jgi:hypothetical protein
MPSLTESLRFCKLKKIAKAKLAALIISVLVIAGSGTAAYSAAPKSATQALEILLVKGRAPKTGYERSAFSDGWGEIGDCTVRNFILKRDLKEVTYRGLCVVDTGKLLDPYTGKLIAFKYGVGTSSKVQIDHVVALSDAWQKGAQLLSAKQRQSFYNDPLNLMAVDGPTNSSKGDADAATWLPPNKAYRCAYVARQIAVKARYKLWVVTAEKAAMKRVLAACPKQLLPTS